MCSLSCTNKPIMVRSFDSTHAFVIGYQCRDSKLNSSYRILCNCIKMQEKLMAWKWISYQSPLIDPFNWHLYGDTKSCPIFRRSYAMRVNESECKKKIKTQISISNGEYRWNIASIKSAHCCTVKCHSHGQNELARAALTKFSWQSVGVVKIQINSCMSNDHNSILVTAVSLAVVICLDFFLSNALCACLVCYVYMLMHISKLYNRGPECVLYIVFLLSSCYQESDCKRTQQRRKTNLFACRYRQSRSQLNYIQAIKLKS